MSRDFGFFCDSNLFFFLICHFFSRNVKSRDQSHMLSPAHQRNMLLHQTQHQQQQQQQQQQRK